MKSSILFVSISLLFVELLSAQVIHRAEIKKIVAQVQQTPDFQISGPKKKSTKPRFWLEIEADVEVETKDPSGFIPELQAHWFGVIKDKTSGESIRLSGTATFKNLRTSEKKVYLSAYIEPDTLERFTGKSKPSESDMEAFALTISGAGIASEGKYAKGLFKATAQEKSEWWKKWEKKTEAGLIVAKSKTPFAPLWTDRYPGEKTESP